MQNELNLPTPTTPPEPKKTKEIKGDFLIEVDVKCLLRVPNSLLVGIPVDAPAKDCVRLGKMDEVTRAALDSVFPVLNREGNTNTPVTLTTHDGATVKLTLLGANPGRYQFQPSLLP
jgi:hypothetical protein